jgi:hypothetical protein
MDQESNNPFEDGPELEESRPLLGFEPSGVRERLIAHWEIWRPIYLCALFALSMEVPGALGTAPNLRMIELAVCRRFYDRHEADLPDELCAVDEVQTRIANVFAILGPLNTLPGLILAIPYGMLADSKGRKLVLALSLIGIILESIFTFIALQPGSFFPFWMIYASTIWLIIGGGVVVMTNIIMTIVADIAPPEIR